MAGTRGSEVPLLDEATRSANVAENERKLRALIKIKRAEDLGGNKNLTEKASLPQQSKKRKKPNSCPSKVGNGGRNLRSQSRINHAVEDPNNEPLGHGSNDIQAGSKSFACVGHDMAQKLGYYPGRDNFFVEVHTSNKTGVLTPLAVPLVNQLQTDTIVGGEVLGLQYYVVLVNVVLKREVELARGYDGMQTMGDAHHMSIAWPSNKIKPCSKPPLLSSQSSGTNGRK